MPSLQPLPGVLFIQKDGGLIPLAPAPTTDTVLIIGNAVDGPVDTPVTLRNVSDIESIFGPVVYKGDYTDPITGTASKNYTGNNLVKAVNECLMGGGQNIVCVRVGGTVASSTNALAASANMYAKYPGRVYNNTSVVITSGSSGYNFTLVQPATKGGTVVFLYPMATTLGDALTSFNTDIRNNSVILTAPVNTFTSYVSAMGTGTITITGGTNGTSAPGEDYATSKIALYTLLTQSGGTFDKVMDLRFDLSVLACVYGDDQVSSGSPTTTSVAQAFAEFNYNHSKETQPSHGIVLLRPTGLTTSSDLATFSTNYYENTSAGYVDQNGKWIKFGYFMNLGFNYVDTDTGETVDIGRHISVCAGPDIVFSNKDLGYYPENGGAAYAGVVSNQPVQIAATNKPLGVVKYLNGSFPLATHKRLNQGIGRDAQTGAAGVGAYVTFKNNSTLGRPVVVSDNTCSQRTSDYHTLQTIRISDTVCRVARDVLFPFIGGPNSPDSRAAMKTLLNKALQAFTEQGALIGGEGVGYYFTIGSDINETLLNQVTISLFIRPAIEIKFIKLVVNITQ